ncbi:MAG: serine/threonine protein phosphatase [Candidatus Synoicihabitans palmerolidicus]|nr:serine/threonine protein phosphatase [Candidatus Synoicihabitans palmerolidicus]
MPSIKDTCRATVHIGYDGRVRKQFRGARAQERFDTEVAVLRHLEQQSCTFVPKLLESDSDELVIVTSNCGNRVDNLTQAKATSLFAELEAFGVRHEDPFARNVTYRPQDGRFCLIDFEFATLLDNPSVALKPTLAPEDVVEDA